MASNYIYTRGKNKTYYARLRVPADLTWLLKCTEKVKSLSTTDRKEAEKLGRKQIAQWEAEFERARQPLALTEADFEALARDYYRTRLDDDHIERRRIPDQGVIDTARAEAKARAIEALVKLSGEEDFEAKAELIKLDASLAAPDMLNFLVESRQIRLKHLKNGLPRRNFALVGDVASALIEANRLAVGEGSPDYFLLCEKLMRAEIEFVQRQLERDDGDLGGTPKDPILQDEKPGFNRLTFVEIIDERRKRSEKRLGGTTSEATLKKYTRITKEFSDWRGSDRAANVSRKEVEAWRDELIESDASTKTVIDKVSCVKSVLSWGQKQSDGKLFPNGLPLDSLELPSKEVGDSAARTYTKEQAAKILTAAREQSKPYLRWVPWLAAYSGARVNELLQLEKQDVFEYEGAWFYKILHQGDRTTKTKTSRTVPLHPAVVEEGFLDFVSTAKDGPLFGSTRMAGNLRDWIRTEVLSDLPEPRPSPMHGFRHLFEDLRLGVIESDASKYITGRAISDSSGGYGKSMALLPELAKQMARFPRLV